AARGARPRAAATWLARAAPKRDRAVRCAGGRAGRDGAALARLLTAPEQVRGRAWRRGRQSRLGRLLAAPVDGVDGVVARGRVAAARGRGAGGPGPAGAARPARCPDPGGLAAAADRVAV